MRLAIWGWLKCAPFSDKRRLRQVSIVCCVVRGSAPTSLHSSSTRVIRQSMHESVIFTVKHHKKQRSDMGPSRFERESEDPQSPRMARLPYGPAVILFAHIPYVPCCSKKERSRSLAPSRYPSVSKGTCQ